MHIHGHGTIGLARCASQGDALGLHHLAARLSRQQQRLERAHADVARQRRGAHATDRRLQRLAFGLGVTETAFLLRQLLLLLAMAAAAPPRMLPHAPRGELPQVHDVTQPRQRRAGERLEQRRRPAAPAREGGLAHAEGAKAVPRQSELHVERHLAALLLLRLRPLPAVPILRDPRALSAAPVAVARQVRRPRLRRHLSAHRRLELRGRHRHAKSPRQARLSRRQRRIRQHTTTSAPAKAARKSRQPTTASTSAATTSISAVAGTHRRGRRLVATRKGAAEERRERAPLLHAIGAAVVRHPRSARLHRLGRRVEAAQQCRTRRERRRWRRRRRRRRE